MRVYKLRSLIMWGGKLYREHDSLRAFGVQRLWGILMYCVSVRLGCNIVWSEICDRGEYCGYLWQRSSLISCVKTISNFALPNHSLVMMNSCSTKVWVTKLRAGWLVLLINVDIRKCKIRVCIKVLWRDEVHSRSGYGKALYWGLCKCIY